MWVIIIELAALAIKVCFGLLCLWIKFTFGFLKYELNLIRRAFKDYPFGFFSFFLHVVGYWAGLFSAYPYGTSWLIKVYSFGLADTMGEMVNLSMWPLLKILEPLSKLSFENTLVVILFIAAMLGLSLIWPVVIICLLEWGLFFVPLLYAALTQLILGLIFRPYLLRWRQWRSDKFFEKARKRSQADPEVQSAFQGLRQQMDNIQQSIADRDHSTHQTSGYQQSYSAATSMEQELRQMGLEPKERLRADGTGTGIMEVELPNYGPVKKAIRDFNESYNRAYEKVTDMSMYCYQAIDFLREQYGENSKAERMYSDMLEKHYDLVDCFKETFDLVCYSEDETGIPKAYEEFKRNILMVKNAQEEFVKTLEGLYGKTLIQAIFKKLRE